MTRRPKSDRSAMLVQGLTVITMLRHGPLRSEEIAEALGVPLRTVQRILAGIRAADLGLTSDRREGSEVYHSLPRKTLAKVMP